MIPIYEPYLKGNESEYVKRCLETGWISSRGEYVEKFENNLAEYLNVPYCLTVSNGTVSLQLILGSLLRLKWINVNDVFLSPSLTYAATVSQGIWLGLKPVLFGSDVFFQPDFDDFVQKFSECTVLGRRPTVLVLPELYGSSPDIQKYVDFCCENNIFLIEDSAEVFGCSWLNKKLGTFGIAGSFSFFANKTICCGEGGAVVTSDKELAEMMLLLRSQAHIGNFEHDGPGFNFRMTNIHAAIGLAQLEQLTTIVNRKRRIYNIYKNELSNYSFLLERAAQLYSTEWMPLFLATENSLPLRKHLAKAGVDSRPCFKPIHLSKGWNIEADIKPIFYENAFNLPCSPNLTDENIERVIEGVKSYE